MVPAIFTERTPLASSEIFYNPRACNIFVSVCRGATVRALFVCIFKCVVLLLIALANVAKMAMCCCC